MKVNSIIKKNGISLGFAIFFILAAVSASQKQELTISLQETDIKDFSASGLSLVFFLNISNSSSSPCFLSGYGYRFVVNQKEYIRLSASLEKRIEIEAENDTLLSFPLKISYADLFQSVAGIEKEDKAHCYFSGAMTFVDEKDEMRRLPFAFSAEFPVFKKPEVELHSLKVKDLTVGGADFDFELSFNNGNSYELFVDKISYVFYVGEKRVGEGTITGDKNIQSRGRKVFSLQFLTNFYDVGKEVYNILQQESASCRLSGEVEVRTVWGNFKIPYDKRGNATISRDS